MIKKSGSDSDFKDQPVKHTLSKFEYDLYKEEENIINLVIRIKRIAMPNKGEKWKIFHDNKVIFVLEGSKLTNKEKSFLHTIEGLNFLIKEFKSGVKSLHHIKTEIKSFQLK